MSTMSVSRVRLGGVRAPTRAVSKVRFFSVFYFNLM